MLSFFVGLFVIIGRAVWVFLKYTLPIIFCVTAFFLCGLMCDGIYGGGDAEWEQEVIKENTYTVTVWWDDAKTISSTISVRSDVNWNINGHDEYARLYGYRFIDGSFDEESLLSQDRADDVETPVLPNEATKEGYIFKGLFTGARGSGIQYVNGGGYALQTVNGNITLYACWEEV